MGGGSELALFYLTTELAKMGLDVHVVIDEGTKEDYSVDGVQVHPLPLPANPVGAYRNTLNKLSKLMDKHRYEVLVDFEQAVKWDKASCGKAVTKFSKSRGVKLVYYFGNHYPWLVPKSESNPWMLWRILREVMDESDKAVAASSVLARAATQRMRWENRRVEVVPFGVRLTEYSDGDRTYRADNSGKVLFVGRIIKHKGLDELVEAASILKEEGHEFTFTVVGPRGGDWDDVPTQYYQELKTKVDKLNLADRFKFTGSLTKELVVSKMAESNVFGFPSHAEGFGVALIQAMAANLTPAVYDLEPMSEIVGPAAVKAKPFDASSLAQAILSADHDKNMKTLVAERVKRFSIDRVAKEFLSKIET
jgi:glycosyltransferase involved in cell wall biosynthesis